MAQKIVHFEIIGKDGKKLQEFYSKLFDWKVDANNPMNYGMVGGDEAGLGGGIASAMDGVLWSRTQVTISRRCSA